MPGISGIVGKGRTGENEAMLQQMIKCMMHESFYKAGTYVNEKAGIGIGWVNHKNAFADCMPVWNENKNICLIFSGEDFTEKSEIERLKTNHHFDPSNASYLVHLYEEQGTKFINRLNGFFSGVVIDLEKKIIFIFNDRYGLGRIYYYETNDGFYFSSEAKSLLKVFPELRRLDLTSLAETFSCGCVLQNRTLFSKILLIPGGSVWTFGRNRPIKKKNYFESNDLEQNDILSETEYYEKLSETFYRILPRYLSGKRKIAMSLTGGFDGRMIMAWANRAPGDLPCYTFGSNYRDCTDVRIARRIAKLCRQSHETIFVGPQFFNEFQSLAEKAVFVSDGTMDVTGSVELYVNSIARQIAPIRLTGNYGSEILRGNVAFKPNSLDESLLEPEFADLTRKASVTYQSEFQGSKLSFIAFKQVPWHHYSRLAVEQSQLTMRSPYLDNDLVSLAYQAPPIAISTNKAFFNSILDGKSQLASIATDRGLQYPPIPIVTTCRNLYEEITFRAEYIYDYGMPKWLSIMDHILAPLRLERLFLGRHKFYHFRIWYRDNLAQYLKDILLDPISLNRPYLEGGRIQKIVQRHIRGQENFTTEINYLLTAELIQRILIENNYK